MAKLKGITVILYEKKQLKNEAGDLIVDGFGVPVCEEIPIEVKNVLVAPAASDDIVANTDLTGKKVVYTLGIPKGDTHDWKDRRVDFFGEQFKTFGFPLKGIDNLIPGEWNMKVMVERYE